MTTVASDASSGPAGPLGDTVRVVQDYVRQEVLGPLRGALRWIAYGLLGAVAIAVGTAFLVLGVLRMIHTEFAATFSGRWMSLLPYAIGLVTCLLVVALALARISTQPLNKENH